MHHGLPPVPVCALRVTTAVGYRCKHMYAREGGIRVVRSKRRATPRSEPEPEHRFTRDRWMLNRFAKAQCTAPEGEIAKPCSSECASVYERERPSFHRGYTARCSIRFDYRCRSHRRVPRCVALLLATTALPWRIVLVFPDPDSLIVSLCLGDSSSLRDVRSTPRKSRLCLSHSVCTPS